MPRLYFHQHKRQNVYTGYMFILIAPANSLLSVIFSFCSPTVFRQLKSLIKEIFRLADLVKVLEGRGFG